MPQRPNLLEVRDQVPVSVTVDGDPLPTLLLVTTDGQHLFTKKAVCELLTVTAKTLERYAEMHGVPWFRVRCKANAKGTPAISIAGLNTVGAALRKMRGRRRSHPDDLPKLHRYELDVAGVTYRVPIYSVFGRDVFTVGKLSTALGINYKVTRQRLSRGGMLKTPHQRADIDGYRQDIWSLDHLPEFIRVATEVRGYALTSAAKPQALTSSGAVTVDSDKHAAHAV